MSGIVEKWSYILLTSQAVAVNLGPDSLAYLLFRMSRTVVLAERGVRWRWLVRDTAVLRACLDVMAGCRTTAEY